MRDNWEFEKQYREKGLSAQRRYPNEALLQFIGSNFFHLPHKERKNTNVLELGCGSGANLWMIAREGFSAYGIDISSTGIKLCSEMLDLWAVTADIRIGNMKRLEFDPDFFDVIYDVVSMQHTDINGHIAAYKEIYKCLKPGGYFFQWHLGARCISFIDGNGEKIDKLTIDNISNPKVPYTGNGITCFLTPSDAREMLESAGFNNILIETVTRTYKQMTQTIEYLSISARKPE